MSRLLLALPVILVGCSVFEPPTPRERCISHANRDLRVLNGLVNETRANVDRGYAIERYQEFDEVRVSCNELRDDGTVRETFCDEVEVRERTRPVAIDLNAERAKLRSLEQRLVRDQARANAEIRQCVAIHPE